jgi:hypothetical protein
MMMSRSGTSTSLTLVDGALGDPAGRAAVVAEDDRGLGHVVELAGEVPGVGGLEGGVGQPLAGAVGRGEVLQDVEALAEVGADGGLDDLARGLGHEAAHARELLHLADVAAGPGGGHQVHRVEVPLALVGVDGELPVGGRVAAVVLEGLDQALGDLLAAVGPEVQKLVVPLALGDGPGLVVLLDAIDLLLRLVDELLLVGGDADVGDADREA